MNLYLSNLEVGGLPWFNGNKFYGTIDANVVCNLMATPYLNQKCIDNMIKAIRDEVVYSLSSNITMSKRSLPERQKYKESSMGDIESLSENLRYDVLDHMYSLKDYCIEYIQKIPMLKNTLRELELGASDLDEIKKLLMLYLSDINNSIVNHNNLTSMTSQS